MGWGCGLERVHKLRNNPTFIAQNLFWIVSELYNPGTTPFNGHNRVYQTLETMTHTHRMCNF